MFASQIDPRLDGLAIGARLYTKVALAGDRVSVKITGAEIALSKHFAGLTVPTRRSFSQEQTSVRN
jgi:hypothetical protein